MKCFAKNSKPFFPIGGQCTNSAPVNTQDRMVFWDSLKAMNANCAEIPVFWETIEETQGSFDFSIVDTLLREARERGLSLILLWFGSWKNGAMKYTPAWVKKDPEVYRRAVSHDGARLNTLSPHCAATREADKRAFAELMAYLRENDQEENTVIAVQVQNEPGILGRSFRDFGTEATELFTQPVCEMFVQYVAGLPEESPVAASWRKAGSKTSGNWTDLFGADGAEFFTAMALADFVGDVAAAGKAAYDLPMLVNVWLGGEGKVPAVDYPCGGAVVKTLELWKFAAPAIDLIAPDIYIGSPRQYEAVCAAYDRPDNPLFVPESDVRHRHMNGYNMFIALGDHGAIGYFNFGSEHLLLPDGTENPAYADNAAGFRSAASVLPLLLQYNRTGKIHTIYQYEREGSLFFDLEAYNVTIEFAYGRTDFIHRYPDTREERGHGLLIEGDKPNEFYLVGGGFRALFTGKPSISGYDERPRMNYINNYLLVEEGSFSADGQWKPNRARTGDESDEGIWLYSDNLCLKVIVCDEWAANVH